MSTPQKNWFNNLSKEKKDEFLKKYNVVNLTDLKINKMYNKESPSEK